MRARRLRRGDAVRLVDGSAREAAGRIVAVRRGWIEVAVEEELPVCPAGPELVLLVAALRPERLSWLAEKATELQASRIVLVRSARTQFFRGGPEVIARLQRVARAAAKQSEQPRWPAIEGPLAFAEASALCASSKRFFLDFGAGELPGALSAESTAVLVGPEGGWMPEEREAARASGWQAAALPAGKLRAETAAIAAIVLLRAAMERKT